MMPPFTITWIEESIMGPPGQGIATPEYGYNGSGPKLFPVQLLPTVQLGQVTGLL